MLRLFATLGFLAPFSLLTTLRLLATWRLLSTTISGSKNNLLNIITSNTFNLLPNWSSSRSLWSISCTVTQSNQQSSLTLKNLSSGTNLSPGNIGTNLVRIEEVTSAGKNQSGINDKGSVISQSSSSITDNSLNLVPDWLISNIWRLSWISAEQPKWVKSTPID